MVMVVGAVETPTAWNPAAGAIVNFDRPLLKDAFALPNTRFFVRLLSLEAAINAKSRLSPLAGVDPLTLILNCLLALLGQSDVPPEAPEIVQSEPLTEPAMVHRVVVVE